MAQTYICKVQRPGDVVVGLITTYLHDAALGWREKGVLSYILAQPPTWTMAIDILCTASSNGRDAVRGALGLLERGRYIHRFKLYNAGRITDWVYLVFPFPITLDRATLVDLFPESQELNDMQAVVDYYNGQQQLQGYQTTYVSARYHGGRPPKPLGAAAARRVLYLKPAEILANIIQRQKKIKVSTAKLNQWADAIRKLHEVDGVSKGRIRTAIDWYKLNAGGAYVPVVESGVTFRTKFLKLEGAMERAGAVTAEMQVGWAALAGAWPKHKHRGMREARRIYYSVYKELPPTEELLGIIQRHAATEEWRKKGGKFIPTLARWLRRGSWEDVLPGDRQVADEDEDGVRVGHS